MQNFQVTSQCMHQREWILTRPILVLYTRLDLLLLPELQFKLLYENDVEIPREIQEEVFGDLLLEISKKGCFIRSEFVCGCEGSP